MSQEQKKTAACANLTDDEIFALAVAARSVNGTIENRTSKTLIFKRYEMLSGIMESGPTQEIPPGEDGTFLAESDGFGTGVEGVIYYGINGVSGDFAFYFNNPFFGRNSYDIRVPSGFSGSFTGGNGNNAAVTYTVRED